MTQHQDLEELELLLEQSGEEIPEGILDLDQFLDNSPLFAALDADGRRKLARLAKYRWASNGEKVYEEGSRGDTFAIIKSGTLVVDATLEGVSKRLAELGPGSVVGEVAVIMDTPRTAMVTAQGDVELFEFSAVAVAPIFEEYPDLRDKLRELIEQRSDQAVQVFLGKA